MALFGVMPGSALSELHDLPEATATAGRPSPEIGMRIGGLAFGELDNGTPITVLRLSLSVLKAPAPDG